MLVGARLAQVKLSPTVGNPGAPADVTAVEELRTQPRAGATPDLAHLGKSCARRRGRHRGGLRLLARGQVVLAFGMRAFFQPLVAAGLSLALERAAFAEPTPQADRYSFFM